MSQDAFFGLVDRLTGALRGNEVLLCNLSAERSDFVRLNCCRIRQAGSVRSLDLGLTLIDGSRQVDGACDLSDDPCRDFDVALSLLHRLRERVSLVPDDPYLNYCRDADSSERRIGEQLPPAAEAVSNLLDAAAGLDLVGLWASGEVSDGFASSLGARHWHESTSFNLDWSCYLTTDKAVKANYAGLKWESRRLVSRLDTMRAELDILARPPRSITPGRYRAYLAPAALSELMEMLAWGGFDLKSHRTRQTPLLRLVQGECSLAPALTVREAHSRGLVPGFTAEGFPKGPDVTLIDQGGFGECLVDARSAKEYGVHVNAGSGYPASLDVTAGDVPRSEVLGRLGTGLYIGNLWYCNWSDPNDCRVTGMTRFGTFWVESGEIVAPVNVMRFDDSLYHLLGDRLEALSVERDLLLSADTYDGRSTDSTLLPGILVSGLELTL